MIAAPAVQRKPSAKRPAPLIASVDDWQFCSDILPRVSRTFALSIAALPEALRDAIRVAYLLCRVVDTVEDDETLGQPSAPNCSMPLTS